MPKKRNTQADQTSIDGTQPPEQQRNVKVERRGKKYVEALAQRMEWQQAENNLKAKLDEAMEADGVSEYWLKDGTKITRAEGKTKIKVKFPKNDEGTVNKPELQTVEIKVD